MADDLTPLLRSFERSLRARKRSPKTIRAYTDAAAKFIAHQAALDRALVAAEVTRADIEDFIIDQLDRWSASTAATRFRCLQQFWRYVVEEGEAGTSPMAKMAPPTLPETTVPVIGTDDLRALIKACEGPGFTNRRDMALVRLFLATGVRLGEMAGLRVADVVLDENVVLVTGKGDRARWVPFGDKAALALDRYDRERRRHPRQASDWWWLSPRGRLTDSGVAQVLRRRSAAAGIDGIHPHRFRHTLAHRWLAAGGTEGDLQELAGWRSAQMVARYGASARSERARSAYRRIDVEGDL